MKISRYNLVIVILLVAFSVVLGLLVWNDRTVENSNENNSNTQLQTINNTTMGDYAFPGVLPDADIKGKKAKITTSKGDIVIELFGDEAPKAVSNFVYLTKEKYYDGLVFHRVEDWVIQTGDPLGNGTGGPGYTFEDEPVTKDYTVGIVGMANAGPNTNGSQFFIVKQDKSLPKAYTIFGKVLSGMDVVNAIVQGDAMTTVVIE